MLFAFGGGQSGSFASSFAVMSAETSSIVAVAGGVSVSTIDVPTVSGPTPYSVSSVVQNEEAASFVERSSMVDCSESFAKKNRNHVRRGDHRTRSLHRLRKRGVWTFHEARVDFFDRVQRRMGIDGRCCVRVRTRFVGDVLRVGSAREEPCGDQEGSARHHDLIHAEGQPVRLLILL